MEARNEQQLHDLVFHPSLFQTPMIDQKINENTNLIQTTNPGEMWQNKVSLGTDTIPGANSRAPFDWNPLDPPLTSEEIDKLIKKADPILGASLNHTTGVGSKAVTGGLGTGLPSLLYAFFMSKANIALLQKQLRYVVFKWSGYHIGDQSPLKLALAMEGIYEAYGKHIDESRTSSKVLFKWIHKEIERLNELLINECAPNIINNVEQHMSFMKSVARPTSEASLDRPIDTRVTGTMEYRDISEIMSAGSLG